MDLDMYGKINIKTDFQKVEMGLGGHGRGLVNAVKTFQFSCLAEDLSASL